jgi:hypothetical protein
MAAAITAGLYIFMVMNPGMNDASTYSITESFIAFYVTVVGVRFLFNAMIHQMNK